MPPSTPPTLLSLSASHCSSLAGRSPGARKQHVATTLRQAAGPTASRRPRLLQLASVPLFSHFSVRAFFCGLCMRRPGGGAAGLRCTSCRIHHTYDSPLPGVRAHVASRLAVATTPPAEETHTPIQIASTAHVPAGSSVVSTGHNTHSAHRTETNGTNTRTQIAAYTMT